MAKPAFRVAAEAEGLADAIRTLGKIDPELKKQLVKEMKKAADPLVALARSLVPTAKPLTNWYGWKGGWDTSKVKRGIKASQRNTAQQTQDRQQQQTIRLLALVQTNAAGAIYDMAGKAEGKGRGSEGERRGLEMIQKLNKIDEPSRTLWPAAERRLGEVQDAVRDAIKDMERTINEELR